MIIITGACGFIGSCLISRLNQNNFNTIVAVDEFLSKNKLKNLNGKRILKRVQRDNFFEWLDEWQQEVEFIFHLGARTDTTEKNEEIFDRLNFSYSKKIWNACCHYHIPLIYASSAATYGDGKNGFDDDMSPENLRPLNPYGVSKNNFDKWVLKQKKKPFFWAGLKFFNVYGPNEYHKGRMASVIFHAYNEIKKNGYLKLFKSHNPCFKDGEQSRDFIYVKDTANAAIKVNDSSNSRGKVINVASGKEISMNKIVKTIIALMDYNKGIIYKDARAGDVRRHLADISLAKQLIEFEPKASFEEGIKETVEWYKKNMHLAIS